jgi:ribosomal protein S18 acetylase RimI-like enzyme
MMDEARRLARRAAETHERFGVGGVLRQGLNRLLVRGASLDILHVILLERSAMRAHPVDTAVQARFLTPNEVRRFARDPANHLSPEFADRADGGLDFCYGAIHGDRLASYGWYALGSVEPEHAAGAALGLPPDVAYMYKVFTHPDFRGRRLNAACMEGALEALGPRGVDRLVSLVYWSNEPSLRSCERLGFRRLGLLVVGPGGPIRIPPKARRLGVTFGRAADPALAARGPGASAASAQA